MRLIIYMGLFLLFGFGFVYAADFQVLQVNNCFNVSIFVHQVGGNLSIPSFDGCSRPVDGDHLFWVCDCHNVVGVFNLTMHTDDSVLDYGSERWYSIRVSYSTYVLNDWSDPLTIKDYGSSLYVYPSVSSDLGGHSEAIYRTVYIQNVSYVYVNHTMFVPVVVNNTVFVGRNVSVFVVNDSALDVVRSDLVSAKNVAAFWEYMAFVLFVFVCVFYFVVIRSRRFLG